MGILLPLGKIGMSMLLSLLTESFLKHALVIGLEKLVKSTESDADDKLLSAAKQAWNMDK